MLTADNPLYLHGFKASKTGFLTVERYLEPKMHKGDKVNCFLQMSKKVFCTKGSKSVTNYTCGGNELSGLESHGFRDKNPKIVLKVQVIAQKKCKLSIKKCIKCRFVSSIRMYGNNLVTVVPQVRW